MEIPTNWKVKEGKWVREYTFETFREAIAFIDSVAAVAERLSHHPEIWNSYTSVRLTLFTHDANVVTEKDKELAEEVNKIF